jgi:hypothetical protein
VLLQSHNTPGRYLSFPRKGASTPTKKPFNHVPPNKPLQRSGMDKVLGRGRGVEVLVQVLRARVLRPQWPVAERSC